jgi:Relaxase/Mobilisation nuclease domain
MKQMIAKISRGSNFGGLLSYLSKAATKEQVNELKLEGHQTVAELIGGNMCGRTKNELTREFRLSWQMNSNCKKPVFHVSLTLSQGETLDRDTWNDLAQSYMEQMGYTDNQYAIFQHHDTEYDHIHIIGSAIQLADGKVVNSSFDYLQSMKIVRDLEREYGLKEVTQKDIPRVVDRALNKRIDRQQREYENGQRNLPPEMPVKYQLQQRIEKAAEGQPSMTELVEKLMLGGVAIKHGVTRTGKSKGISYELNKVACSGTQLGGAYTWQGLQQYLGVNHEPERDEKAIQELIKLGVAGVQKQYQEKLAKQIENQASLLRSQLEKTTQRLLDRQLIEKYQSVDLEELRDWYDKAAEIDRGGEYLERIAAVGKTLQDWQGDSSVGWDEVQQIDLDEIRRQMEIDKAEHQKISEAPTVRVQSERSPEKPARLQSEGMQR